MTQPARSKYMESKVLTASQPQLHLMLLEGAVRFGQKAIELWDDQAQAAAVDSFIERLMDITEELSRSTTGRDNEISLRLEEEYAYLYRELASCRMNQDRSALQKCLELLNYQRDTWRMACEQLENVEETPMPKSGPAPVSYVASPTDATSFSLDA